MGGDNPIRVQSMTTTDTMDTEGSIAQSIRMIKAGCELVELPHRAKKRPINLGPIKDGIRAAKDTIRLWWPTSTLRQTPLKLPLGL